MTKNRIAANIDNNQNDIVDKLRKIPGVSVEVGHDDILVGYRGKTYWYEIKDPAKCVSKKTKVILTSCIKDDQIRILANFKGHYRIITTA